MINLKKMGLTALAGSLVAVSAHAGEISVSGSANVTYKEGNGGKEDAIGTDKDVTFSGSGELDNGWTFAVGTLMTDAFDVSSSYTSITMGDMGSLQFGADTGGVAYAYDEEVPQAYEQTSDAQQNSANIVGNRMDSNMIVYNSPSFDLGGASAKFGIEYSKNANGTSANDGGTAANTDSSTNVSDQFGQGIGLGVTLSYDALTVGAYGAERENITQKTTAETTAQQGNDKRQDDFQGVWFAKYAFGPVAVGYSESYHDAGLTGSAVATTSAKVVGDVAGIFESDSVSIAFNVNDDLSISWTDTEDTYNPQAQTGGIGNVSQDTTAIQIAYSMGAMSIKAYNMDTTNPGYDEDAQDVSVNEIALGLAF
jgi:outer membrane protein OmpU